MKELKVCAGMPELAYWLYKGTPVVFDEITQEWRIVLGKMDLLVSQTLMMEFVTGTKAVTIEQKYSLQQRKDNL